MDQLEFLKPKMTFGDTLKFTPYAWSKLIWMRDKGNTEVAGFCVTATNDPLLVTDFNLIKEKCTIASFDLDTNDLAEYQDLMLDTGLAMWQSVRILAHTHPGNSPHPSPADEENFERAFGAPDWAIMLIVAKNGETYCRLKVNVGPGITKQLKVTVDFSQEFRGSEHKNWENEYKLKVRQLYTINMANSMAIELEKYNISDIDDELKNLDCFWNMDCDVEFWDKNSEEWYMYNPINNQWYNDIGEIAKDRMTNKNGKLKYLPSLIVKWAEKYWNEREFPVE